MTEVWALGDFGLAGEIGQAHLRGTDMIRGPEMRSVFFLWSLLEFFLFDVLQNEFLLIAKAHLQEAS